MAYERSITFLVYVNNFIAKLCLDFFDKSNTQNLIDRWELSWLTVNGRNEERGRETTRKARSSNDGRVRKTRENLRERMVSGLIDADRDRGEEKASLNGQVYLDFTVRVVHAAVRLENKRLSTS